MKSFQIVTIFAIIGAALGFAPNQIAQGMSLLYPSVANVVGAASVLLRFGIAGFC
jgi:hypothetical protein